jgi:hypothetical protein
VPVESDLCSTDDGGRTWREIFSCCNFIFGFAHTSAMSGVVESGYRAAGTFWTRDNGARWYTLPNVPAQDFLTGAGGRAPVFAGRGLLLFWAQNVSLGIDGTLNQITGWPATVDPPCRRASDSDICRLTLDQSPFESREVATMHGLVEGMRIVPGGVAALLNPAAAGEALSVLVYRDGPARTTQLPKPPVAPNTLANVAFAVAWPRLFVERGAFDAYGVNRADVLWRSTDAGASWRVQSARLIPRRALATGVGRVGAAWPSPAAGSQPVAPRRRGLWFTSADCRRAGCRARVAAAA